MKSLTYFEILSFFDCLTIPLLYLSSPIKKSLKTTVMVKEEYQILYVLREALWMLLSSFSLPS